MKPVTDMASSRNTDYFLPVWSRIGYSIEVFVCLFVFFVFSGEQRASLPFALKRTAKRFWFHKDK